MNEFFLCVCLKKDEESESRREREREGAEGEKERYSKIFVIIKSFILQRRQSGTIYCGNVDGITKPNFTLKIKKSAITTFNLEDAACLYLSMSSNSSCCCKVL